MDSLGIYADKTSSARCNLTSGLSIIKRLMRQGKIADFIVSEKHDQSLSDIVRRALENASEISKQVYEIHQEQTKSRPTLEKFHYEMLPDPSEELENGIGLRATAKILIPVTGTGGTFYITQEITSGGIFGVDPDDNREYLQQLCEEEAESLGLILEALNVNFSAGRKHPINGEELPGLAALAKSAHLF